MVKTFLYVSEFNWWTAKSKAMKILCRQRNSRESKGKGGTMPEAVVSYLLGSAKESNRFGKETCLKKEVRARGICVRQKFILEKNT